MVDSHWLIADNMGKRWRLWIARGAPGRDGLSAEAARNTLRGLLYFSLGRRDRYDRVSKAMFEIYNELAVAPKLSHDQWLQDDATAGRYAVDRIEEVLDRAARGRQLCIEPVREPTFVAPDVEETPDTAREPAPPETTSRYEIAVFDEHGAALAGIEVVFSTPAGTEIKPTDAGGVARVDQAPAGIGTARIRDIAVVRALLAGRQRQRRRMTKFPDGDDWTVATLTAARDAVTLPSGARQNLMIVTRTDVYSAGHPSSWGELSEEERQDEAPWRLEAGREARLHLNADGTGASASVFGEAGKAPTFEPPNVEPPPAEKHKWIAPDLYVVQAGDTLEGIAKRYLHDSRRFVEIVGKNPGTFATRSPDLIVVGEQLRMPPDGVPLFLKAKALNEERAASPAAFEAPRFMQVDVDVLHDLLFQGNLDRALELVAALPIDRPEDPATRPPPILESLLVEANVAALALEGHVDGPAHVEVEEVYPPMVKKVPT